ncbi:hypothetical protein B0H14DRAFT_2602706 [Mycena olivaceomarginata]|nr:hypothetical protein B0H14DRAFT_2602706 [Mycena olivaceomarginata]
MFGARSTGAQPGDRTRLSAAQSHKRDLEKKERRKEDGLFPSGFRGFVLRTEHWFYIYLHNTFVSQSRFITQVSCQGLALALFPSLFDPLDRWLASVKMKTAPDLFLGSPLPDGDAIWLIASQGLTGRHYNLSLAVYHPRLADRATPDIELARFVGHADDPGAPIWVLEGTTDIPIGPVLQIGSDEKHLVRLRLYNLWLCDALAIAPTPPALRPIRRRSITVKWVRGRNLRGNKSVFYTATAVQTVEVPVDVQTETLATDEHTAKVPRRTSKPNVTTEYRK